MLNFTTIHTSPGMVHCKYPWADRRTKCGGAYTQWDIIQV